MFQKFIASFDHNFGKTSNHNAFDWILTHDPEILEGQGSQKADRRRGGKVPIADCLLTNQ
jgi:hypothetical protein